MKSRWKHALLIVAASWVGVACDQVRFRDAGAPGPATVLQPQSFHTLVTPRGLEALYRASAPDGLLVQAAPIELDHERLSIRVGPVDQHLEVERWAVAVDDSLMAVELHLTRPAILVPVRVHDGIAHQICRFEVRLDEVELRGDVAVVRRDGIPELAGEGEMALEAASESVRLIGSCSLLEASGMLELADGQQEQQETMSEVVLSYVNEALIESAEWSFRASPLDTLGLIRRRVELARRSPFENRRGHMLAEGRLSGEGAMRLSRQGLEVSLDVASSAKRAGCAPLGALTANELGAALPVAAAELDQHGADVGVVLSTALIARLWQVMTSAGFGCQGLEDVRRNEENPDSIPADGMRLEDIGLDKIGVGSWVRLNLGPSSLPEIEARPGLNDLKLRWSGFHIEVFSEMHSAPVRILEVQAAVELGIRPRVDARTRTSPMVQFEIDSVTVSDVTIESPWLAAEPGDENLQRWTRRLMLLALQDKLVLPLPVEPGTPLRLVGSQIRANDTVLMLKFE